VSKDFEVEERVAPHGDVSAPGSGGNPVLMAEGAELPQALGEEK
jgi:hypothetical protein